MGKRCVNLDRFVRAKGDYIGIASNRDACGVGGVWYTLLVRDRCVRHLHLAFVGLASGGECIAQFLAAASLGLPNGLLLLRIGRLRGRIGHVKAAIYYPYHARIVSRAS